MLLQRPVARRIQRVVAARGARSERGHAWLPRRELGWWTVRPARGWRSIRWVTPPLHMTRAFSARDTERAYDWAMDRLGIG